MVSISIGLMVHLSRSQARLRAASKDQLAGRDESRSNRYIKLSGLLARVGLVSCSLPKVQELNLRSIERLAGEESFEYLWSS